MLSRVTYFWKTMALAFGLIWVGSIAAPNQAVAQTDYTSMFSTGFGMPQTPSANGEKCNPYTDAGGNLTNKCIDGTRWDISASCVKGLNNSSNNCLNTMPVENVVRVPEDVCFRNWTNRTGNHNGMDYASEKGNAITAAADGCVAEVNYCSSGGGLKVVIWHPRPGASSDWCSLKPSERFQSVYMHMSKITTSHGTKVKKGDKIGEVGRTNCKAGGKAYEDPKYGLHLHFEIQSGNGLIYDPMCDEIQGLCGGQSMELSKCRKEGTGNEFVEPGKAKAKGSGTSSGTFGSQTSFPGGSGAGGSTTGGQSYSEYENVNVGGMSNSDECRSLNEYETTFEDCIFCNIFVILFNTASDIAQRSFDTLAPWVINVVLVGMALWIALKVLTFVAVMEVKDPRVMIKELLQQIFVAFVIIVILRTDLQAFMSIIIEPIFNTGFKLAKLALGDQECTLTGASILEHGGLPASMGNDIVCTVMGIQEKIYKVIAMGSLLICIGWYQESFWHIPIFLHWGFFLSGLGIWVGGTLLLLIYPFLLVDVILQLAVAMALLPAAIGAYTFKITRQYVGKIFETIMNAMFTFVFLTIIIYLIASQLEMVLQEQFYDKVKDVNNLSNSTLLDRMGWSGTAFIRIFFISILGWAVLGSVSDFTSMFSSGGISLSKPIGSRVGTTLYSGAKAIGVGTWGVAAKYAKPKLTMGLGNIQQKLNKRLIKYRARQVSNGTPPRTKWFSRRTLVRSTATGVHGGLISIKTETTATKGVKIESQNDSWIRIRTRTTPTGQVSRTSDMRNGPGKILVNKSNGKVESANVIKIRNGSEFDQKDIDEAIVREIIKSFMPAIAAARFINEQYDVGTRSWGYNSDGDFEITQNNADGSKQSLTWKMGGSRSLITVKEISSSGEVTSYTTDGMINKVSSYRHDNAGNVIASSVRTEYGFTEHYRKKDKAPISKKGKVRKDIDLNGSLYSAAEIAELKQQFMHGRGNLKLYGFM